MPVYEFECTKCGEHFELTRPMAKASAGAKCPKCKAKAQRRFSATIITTGTGGSDFDLDESMMPDLGGMGGGDHGHSHGPPDLGDDFDF